MKEAWFCQVGPDDEGFWELLPAGCDHVEATALVAIRWPEMRDVVFSVWQWVGDEPPQEVRDRIPANRLAGVA